MPGAECQRFWSRVAVRKPRLVICQQRGLFSTADAILPIVHRFANLGKIDPNEMEGFAR